MEKSKDAIPPMKYLFETRLEVRDYECDIEGIVNNANYLHYIEHTRHLFLKSLGVSFAEMHAKGVDAVVARMNMQFMVPLRCDDMMRSCLSLKKEGVRYVFFQDLYREADGKLAFRAKVELVCLMDGQLVAASPYDEVFKDVLQE